MARKTKQVEPTIEVQQVQSVTYQDVLNIENMLPDINTNAAKRAVITEFVRNQFGEVIMSYCDQICQQRIKKRVQELKEKLK